MKPIIKKELNNMLTSPAYYIILTVFIGLLNFLFLKGFFLSSLMNFRGYIELQIWFLMIFIPAISMRILSEEIKSHTLELLLTKPISLLHILGGKYLSLLIYFGIFILSSIILYFSLQMLGEFPGGIIISQIMGSILLIASMFSVSFLASSITRNQVFAFLLGVCINFILIIFGTTFIQMSFPPFFAHFISSFSFITHSANFSKGIIHIGDVVYFLSIIFFGLYLSYISIRRFQKTGKTGLGILSVSELMIVLAILIVGNVLIMKTHLTIDITPGNIYTLSESTKSILSEVDDRVNIDFYVSKELPPELQLLATNLHDTIDQFNSYAHGNIQLTEIHPVEDEKEKEANAAGVPSIQIQTMKNDQFATQKGYLGLSLTFVDKRDVIPYLGNAQNLEYALVSKILKLTQKERKTLSLVASSDIDEKILQNIGSTLNENYDVHLQKVAHTDKELTSKNDAIYLIIEGSSSFSPEMSMAIQGLSDSVVLYFFQPYSINLKDGITATKNISPLAQNILKKYNFTIEDGIVGDARYNSPVNFNQGNVSYMVPYPLFPKVFVTKDIQLGEGVDTIDTPFIASLSGGGEGISDILTTSEYGFLHTDIANNTPDKLGNINTSQLKKLSVGKMMVSGDAGKNKMVIIPSSTLWTMVGPDILTKNLTFTSNLIDSLGGDQRLINIRSKTLKFENFAHDIFKNNLIRGINVYALPLLILLTGLTIAFVRNRKRS